MLTSYYTSLNFKTQPQTPNLCRKKTLPYFSTLLALSKKSFRRKVRIADGPTVKTAILLNIDPRLKP
jgi:hypothetical protein